MTYGRNDYDDQAGPTLIDPAEPVFVLRAQDVAAAATVRHYADLLVDVFQLRVAVARAQLAESQRSMRARDVLTEIVAIVSARKSVRHPLAPVPHTE